MSILMTKGARPIIDTLVNDHYKKFKFHGVDLSTYADAWRRWLTSSVNKTINGLDHFSFVDYTCGTSQAFDQFCIRNNKRRLVCFAGEFQYHSCLGKYLNFKILTSWEDLDKNDALILSFPFSDFGDAHPNQSSILKRCNQLSIPVCLDLAHWGVAKNLSIDLMQYPCVVEVTCSLSKPFYTLENHRVGVRFTREYVNDGISMINEVNMQNKYSISLGVFYLDAFSPDCMWEIYLDKYKEVCRQWDLIQTNVIIFGLSNDNKYNEYNRGIPGNHRICISNLLADT